MKKVATLRVPVGVDLSNPRHLMRFLKRERGDSVEDIAAAERVSVETVRNSIREVDTYRRVNDATSMDVAIRNVVIETAPKLKRTIERLLEAKEFIRIKDHKTGKEEDIEVDDKTTQLEAVKATSSLIMGLQPKQAPVTVAVQQNTQVNAPLSTAETTEERLRRLRAKAAEANLLPAEVAAVPESLDRDEDEEEEDDEEGEDS